MKPVIEQDADKLFNESARCFEVISKATTKTYTLHVIKLLETNDEVYNHLTARSFQFPQFFTVLCRCCIQSEGRRWLSKNSFVETALRVNFQLLTNLTHELKRPAIFALCNLTKESMHRAKFKPDQIPQNSQIINQTPQSNCTG